MKVALKQNDQARTQISSHPSTKKSSAGFKNQKPKITSNGANGKRGKKESTRNHQTTPLQNTRNKSLTERIQKAGRTGGRNNNQGRGNGAQGGAQSKLDEWDEKRQNQSNSTIMHSIHSFKQLLTKKYGFKADPTLPT